LCQRLCFDSTLFHCLHIVKTLVSTFLALIVLTNEAANARLAGETREKEGLTAMARLRELRESHYISRKELAVLAGVSESTLVRMEEGKTHTTEEAAKKVLAALSQKIGQEITLQNIEGLNLYNLMRDRRHHTKARTEGAPEQAHGAPPPS
jgi:transcriptional regulator with XRE-family HTH domain